MSASSNLSRKFLVPEPMRFVSLLAESFFALCLIGLEVTFAPVSVAVTFERQDMRCNPVEEPSIVRDHNHASDEAEDRFLESSQRVDVQVVRRFVKQQNIAAASQQLGQVNPVSLTTGKIADLLFLIRTFEIELRYVRSRVQLLATQIDPVVSTGNLLVDRVGVGQANREIDPRSPVRPSHRFGAFPHPVCLGR